MSDNISMTITIPEDESGMVGRKCPNSDCKIGYFKLKPGTGLTGEIQTNCPYCSTEGDAGDFLTDDQMEYAKSIVLRDMVGPILADFKHDIESLNHSTHNSWISLKFSVETPAFRLHQYREEDIETTLTCSTCGLVFSIYGVFATCPDCGQINDFDVFTSNLLFSRKKLHLSTLEEATADPSLADSIRQDALTNAISVFDALGKKLRERFPANFPAKPRNLFQNIIELDTALLQNSGQDIVTRIGTDNKNHLFLMFQVRHIMEHNMGVIDQDFINKVPAYTGFLGRKYPLVAAEIERLFEILEQLVATIKVWLIP